MSAVEQPVALTPVGFDILRSAVTLARSEQIQRLSTLRTRLNQLYPYESTQIEAAIEFWANRVAQNKLIH